MRLKETCVVFVAVCLLVSSCEESKVQECGAEQFSVESRIFGGEPLEESNIEFPWLVALHHRSARSFFCAGSLISAKHVLSGKIVLSGKNNSNNFYRSNSFANFSTFDCFCHSKLMFFSSSFC